MGEEVKNEHNDKVKTKRKKSKNKVEERGDEKNQKANNDNGQDKDGSIKVVLKVDMHCEGCAMKIKRSLRVFEGVEKVMVDDDSGKVTVEGRFDLVKLCERVEMKAHRKVVVISSPNIEMLKKEKEKKNKKTNVVEDVEKKGEQKKDEKKEIPKESTVVLKIRLRCDCGGCIQRIRRTISKIEGVDGVLLDIEKATITVKGTMDAKSLTPYIQEKLKRTIDVILPKAKDGDAIANDKNSKSNDKATMNVEKEEKNANDNSSKNHDNDNDKGEEKNGELSRMDYYVGPFTHGHYGMVHAPQIFSDENPNACVLM